LRSAYFDRANFSGHAFRLAACHPASADQRLRKVRRENVIAVGNSRTGKSHIGLGLGLAACQKGL